MESSADACLWRQSVNNHLGKLQHLGFGRKRIPLGDRELRDPVNE
jgi:hypothetical protein